MVLSVVVVVVAGLGAVVSCVVVVELRVASALLSFTVVQADSDTRMVAARNGMMSFFMSMIVTGAMNLPSRKYSTGWSCPMGCNPTKRPTKSGLVSRRTRRPQLPARLDRGSR